jgi:hypothetical protein
MADAESIDRLLTVAASLLDLAAAEIRDAKLEPVRENIHRIGVALSEVFEIQQSIYAAHPGLAPKFLAEQSPLAESNKLLTEYLARALRIECDGDRGAAVAELEAYLALETSELHRNIARGQIGRIRNGNRA